MSMLALCLSAVLLVYLVLAALLISGTRGTAIAFAKTPREALPTVSVLVAARNEEHCLRFCLASLLASDYPPDKLEIICVNDRSTDRTLHIAEEFAQHDARMRVLTVTHRLPNMSGKASALCHGLQQAAGEIILMTDADCIVPRLWVRAMVAQFTPEVGVVGGFTLLSPAPAMRDALPPNYCDRLFAKIQTLDWMYLLTVGAGAAGLGKPVSILGNNFGFRRVAYEHSGGYAQLGFSIIEDFALMQKIVTTTPWRVRFSLAPATSLFSFPSRTWREYLEQRKRWAAGGKEVGAFAKVLMLVAFFAHLSIFLSVKVSPMFCAMACGAVLLVDFALLWRCANALRYRVLLRYFPLFELYFLLYSLVLAAIVLFPTTVHWKGRRYRWNLRGQMRSIEE